MRWAPDHPGEIVRARLTRRDALLLALGASTLRPVTAATTQAPSQRKADIDSILQNAVSAREVPGVVAMAATDRAIIYEGAFGPRCLGTQAKMSTDTVFRIASMVKLLTSVAAMQLVESGKLALDEPASKVDPELGSIPVLTGFDAKGHPQLRPPLRPITLRNLLTHTSGFSYPLWDENAVRYYAVAGKTKGLPRRPLFFDPDTRWSYGGSIDKVGRLVEIASGEPLDRYFLNHICQPLGMKDTGFEITAAQRVREANLHVRKADGTLLAKPLEKANEPHSHSGGGGIYSTAPDYLTLLQAMLSGGSLNGAQILKPETVALMSANQTGEIEAGHMKTTSPGLSNDVDFFPGVRLRWAFGHMTNLDSVKDGRKPGSLTWAGLYNTYYWIDPASNVAGVIMMQVLPFADTRALDLYRKFERGVYRALKPA
jgi:CubicO group peptidase (beta-lactamase class C family)